MENTEEPQKINPITLLSDTINAASSLIESLNYKEALKLMGDSLKSLTSTLGDLHPTLHKLYFLYGDTILLKHENDNDSKSSKSSEKILFSSSSPDNGSSISQNDIEPNEEPAKELKDSDSDSVCSPDVTESLSSVHSSHKIIASEQINEPKPADLNKSIEQELDLQLVWENLETARVIIQSTKPIDYPSLFKTQSRLGDLQSYIENFEQACQEYLSALNTLHIIDSSPSRSHSSIHYMIAHNYLQIKGKEKEAEFHFKESYKILESFVSLASEPELSDELKTVMNEIKLKIEDAKEQHESFKSLRLLENEEKNKFDPIQIPGPKIEVKVRKLSQPGDFEVPDEKNSKKKTEPF